MKLFISLFMLFIINAIGNSALADGNLRTPGIATVKINWLYQPYPDETGWVVDFSQCPTQFTFDHGKGDVFGDCRATINDMPVYVSYELDLKTHSPSNGVINKVFSSNFTVLVGSPKPTLADNQSGMNAEMDSVIKQVSFNHHIWVPRTLAQRGNTGKLVYQFIVNATIVDN